MAEMCSKRSVSFSFCIHSFTLLATYIMKIDTGNVIDDDSSLLGNVMSPSDVSLLSSSSTVSIANRASTDTTNGFLVQCKSITN